MEQANTPELLLGSTVSKIPSGNPSQENIQAVATLERLARGSRTVAVRLSDAITAMAGSQWSLAFHAVWFSAWIIINTHVLSLKPFDPFPFSLLTSIVSLEAIFLALFVLASQNRLTREAEKRAHLDLQVNLLAEQEMTVVLQLLRNICARLAIPETTRSEHLEALSKSTDVLQLAQQVQETLDTPACEAPALPRA